MLGKTVKILIDDDVLDTFEPSLPTDVLGKLRCTIEAETQQNYTVRIPKFGRVCISKRAIICIEEIKAVLTLEEYV